MAQNVHTYIAATANMLRKDQTKVTGRRLTQLERFVAAHGEHRLSQHEREELAFIRNFPNDGFFTPDELLEMHKPEPRALPSTSL